MVGLSKTASDKISLIIPAYNEQNRIPVTLRSISHFVTLHNDEVFVDEIIIVDDGSTDKTVERIMSFKKLLPVKVIRKKNGGKWSAISVGIESARNDLILLMDADGSASIWHLQKGVPNEGYAIFGSRFEELSKVHDKGFIRRIVSKVYKNYVVFWYYFFDFMGGDSISDMQCPYKLFRKSDMLAPIKTKQFAGDIELALKLNSRIVSIPVEFFHKDGSKVSLSATVKMLFHTPVVAYQSYKEVKLEKMRKRVSSA